MKLWKKIIRLLGLGAWPQTNQHSVELNLHPLRGADLRVGSKDFPHVIEGFHFDTCGLKNGFNKCTCAAMCAHDWLARKNSLKKKRSSYARLWGVT